MKITLTIETDNAAFQEADALGDFNGQCAYILHALAHEWAQDGPRDRTVRDTNGNTVGRVTVTP